jgi:peptide/nickel transport system ATP-binding protein
VALPVARTPDPTTRPRTGGTAFLEVRNLTVRFPTDDGVVRAVNDLSFSLEPGKTLGIVGESGSGKSVTSLAIMGLHKGTRAEVTGEIWLDGRDVVKMTVDDIRRLRGREMAMIFQDPLSSLHPYFRVGDQLVEAYRVHHDVPVAAARTRAIELLDRVGIPSPDKRFHDFPHQFSGGMRQRAMIAMALMCDPTLLIADEPTTALDVTVQAQILDLMADLQREFGSAIIMITHDLGVVAQMADSVVVMYGGRAVEAGPTREIFYRPHMPYTWGLLGSIPRVESTGGRLLSIQGSPPSLINLPPGCPFEPRCTFKEHVEGNLCATDVPELAGVGADHAARCHIPALVRQRIYTETVRVDRPAS